MNNVLDIKRFLNKSSETTLLINQVSEEIGFFYIGLVESESRKKKIKLKYSDNFTKETTGDLFTGELINICFTNNARIIDEHINSEDKCIIYTDYKNFKKYSNSIAVVNGYNYIKDIEFYITEILNIDNSDILEFCMMYPYLTFSEISKYLVNSSNYIKENNEKKNNNFILEIRKELFNLKKKQKKPLEIYSNLKKEVKYKKFNFLAY